MVFHKFKGHFLFLIFLLMGIETFGQDTYLDNFNTTSYSNNNGTLNFATNWVETNETTSATGGRILITSNQLRFRNLDSRYITRTLDLNGATSVTLTLDYDRTNGNESISVQLYNGSSYNTVATLAGTGSLSYTLDPSEISSSSGIRFRTGSGNWGSSETIYVDNVQFTANYAPMVLIGDITVNEGDGTASFTVTHSGVDASGPFTVVYETVDGTATTGSDYSNSTGTLGFTGTAGDTEQITVTILDDVDYESDENYTIQFTATSDVSVVISDTATGTITDNETILDNTPLALFEEFDGYIGYTSTGGTFRTQDNNTDPCAVTTSSSNTLTAAIPIGATIDKAYLYWAHSAALPDTQVTFEGTTVNANYVYTTSAGSGRLFYGGVSDVTSIVNGVTNPSTNVFDFTDLTIDTSSTYCDSATVLGGWSLLIFYTDLSLPAATINLYQGFHGESNSASSYSLSGFYAIGSTGSKTTVLSWEGDQTLSNNELLSVTTGLGTNTLSGDGDNNGTTTINPFNSTIFDNTISPNVNITTSYGVDLDTYDVSPYIQPGESSVTTNVQSGQDFVILNALVLKVPSNLVTGTVFEDVNYGGGSGRNILNASGVPIEGVTVELYDNGGTLVQTQITDASGKYVFAGMANSTYSIRVVNNTVRSSRTGGVGCSSCIPIQTFRADYLSSTLTETTGEIGGSDPSTVDPSAGVLTGAQTVSNISITSEGVAGLDFGFNFNTIVNTNETGQGSLDQFIINSNALDETGLDIETNSIFNPAAGDDTSVFMIPPTGDVLGRTADSQYSSGYFNILTTSAGPLSTITDSNTVIDGRTQTAYSGDTNTGTVGSGGTTVGTSSNTLPNYDLPEIQIQRDNTGDALIVEGSGTVIRNVSVFANNFTGIRVDNGSVSVLSSLLGVNALGLPSGNIDYGIEIVGGSMVVDGNYIASNADAGILINGGTSTLIQNNHITSNGNTACADNITILSGAGIVIQQNLIDNAASLGIDGDGISGNVSIIENTLTNSGQNGGNCSGNTENAAILLDGSNSSITNNIITANGGAGVVLAGGATSGNLISQNAIYANGTTADALGIDLDPSDSVGDGVTLNDNNDSDSGPNGAVNFPIISSSYTYGSNLIIKGWSRPGATIEVFLTDVNEGSATEGDNQLGMSTDYGEGQIYLGSAIEGSGSDLDGGTASYTDMDGNTDNTNRFWLTIPITPGTVTGNYITATTTLLNSTSEFSPFSILKVRTIITNRRITFRINKS